MQSDCGNARMTKGEIMYQCMLGMSAAAARLPSDQLPPRLDSETKQWNWLVAQPAILARIHFIENNYKQRLTCNTE